MTNQPPDSPHQMFAGYPRPPGGPQYYRSVQEDVVIETMYRGGVNHVLHILLALLTCGFWLPIYLLMWLIRSDGR
ncbi:hypothetical protein [Skermania piniformis]|uniref:PspC domain-containing protein n=1 Tax=Skermania pinensis TaxID=39122 RepID=A0ABX8SBA4_9ACTN|nr:hypothetical protein [Skermania piniformis]QXQ15143.1 hypothetical protein KV203_07310 [Skermania piniformis]